MLFFFQAEDGIRDLIVTGVQTCALPISHSRSCPWQASARRAGTIGTAGSLRRLAPAGFGANGSGRTKIGRGSGRGRGEISVGAVSLKKKKERIGLVHEAG